MTDTFRRNLILVLGFACVVTAHSVKAQDRDPIASDAEHPILRELSTLPEELVVAHTPNPALAQLGGRSGFRYTWLYQTTVVSKYEPIVIESFGAFWLVEGEWVFANVTGKPFSKEDFADWYACAGAVIESGQACTDGLNWTGNDRLDVGKVIWYYIGRNAAGRRVQGHAVINHLNQIKS